MDPNQNNNNNLDQLAALEALLFAHGEPVSMNKIEKVLRVEAGKAEELVNLFKEELKRSERGLVLVFDSGKVQLSTKSQFGKVLSQFIKDELSEELSPAALETLSIIAYLGPITRTRLEYFRGVNSFFTLRNLMLRGLIERFPDPERVNSFLYKLTIETIRHLGLTDITNLPDYGKTRKLLEVLENPPVQNQFSVATQES